MKMTLSFVPPGGGETDYELPFDLPEIPRAGDYLYIKKLEEIGTCDFVVRRVHWTMEIAAAEEVGRLSNITVECEFAKGYYSSENHKKCVEMYEARGKGVIRLDASVY